VDNSVDYLCFSAAMVSPIILIVYPKPLIQVTLIIKINALMSLLQIDILSRTQALVL
jgi:hypothetical protein